MKDLLEGVDNMDTFYECHCEGILGKSTYNIYPSEKEKAFIKLKHVKGRNDITCLCELITKDNKKIKTTVSGDAILNRCDLIQGTPKKLKLYKSNDSSFNNWEKPDDSFSDSFSIPLDEEFTADGYYLYKEFQLELRRLNITAKEYYERFC